MTREEIASMIGSLEIPFAYYQFPEGTQLVPPFICFYYSGSSDMMADNINYQKIDHLVIELYSKEKDFDLEAQLESALTGYDLTWARSEQYLDDEQLMVEVYDLDVIITEDSENA